MSRLCKLAVFVVALLVVNGVVQASPVLLSQGATAFGNATSYFGDSFPYAALTDGSTSAAFALNHGAGSWAQVDLGQSCTLDSLRMMNATWGGAYGLEKFHATAVTYTSTYQTSGALPNNGTDWTTVSLGSPITARIVRFYMDTNYAARGSISEFQAFAGTTLLSQGKPVAWTHSYDDTVPWVNAVDGNTTALGGYLPAGVHGFFEVDLGSVKTIDSFKILNGVGADTVKNFRIETFNVSETPLLASRTLASDETNWQSFDVSGAAATASAVRVYIDTAYGGGAALKELQVYGSPVPEPATMTLLAAGGLGLLARRKK